MYMYAMIYIVYILSKTLDINVLYLHSIYMNNIIYILYIHIYIYSCKILYMLYIHYIN